MWCPFGTILKGFDRLSAFDFDFFIPKGFLHCQLSIVNYQFKKFRRGAPPGIGYDYRSSSGTKSRVMDLRSVFSWVNFTPADSIIRLEARVDMESAYLSER